MSIPRWTDSTSPPARCASNMLSAASAKLRLRVRHVDFDNLQPVFWQISDRSGVHSKIPFFLPHPTHADSVGPNSDSDWTTHRTRPGRHIKKSSTARPPLSRQVKDLRSFSSHNPGYLQAHSWDRCPSLAPFCCLVRASLQAGLVVIYPKARCYVRGV